MHTLSLNDSPPPYQLLDPARHTAPSANLVETAAETAAEPAREQKAPATKAAAKLRPVASGSGALAMPAGTAARGMRALFRRQKFAEPAAASSLSQRRAAGMPALPYEVIERIFAEPAAAMTPRKLRNLATDKNRTFFNFNFNENVLKSNVVWAAWVPTPGASHFEEDVPCREAGVLFFRSGKIMPLPAWTDPAANGANEELLYAVWVKRWRATDDETRSDLDSLYQTIDVNRLLFAKDWSNGLEKPKQQTWANYFELQKWRRTNDYSIVLARMRAARPKVKQPKAKDAALRVEHLKTNKILHASSVWDFHIASAALAHTVAAQYLLAIDMYREPRAMSRLWLEMLQVDAARTLYYLKPDLLYILRRKADLKKMLEFDPTASASAGQPTQEVALPPAIFGNEQARLDWQLDQRLGLLQATGPQAGAQPVGESARTTTNATARRAPGIDTRLDHWSRFDVAGLLNRANELHTNATAGLPTELKKALLQDKELCLELADGVRTNLSQDDISSPNTHPAFYQNWTERDHIWFRDRGTMVTYIVR